MIKLFDTYKVPYKLTGNRHCRVGWVQVNCPFCIQGDNDWHMGYKIEGNGVFSCYRCGGHGVLQTLTRLLKLPHKQVSAIIRQYIGVKDANAADIRPILGDMPRTCILPPCHDLKRPRTPANEYMRQRFSFMTQSEFEKMVDDYGLCFTDWKSPIMPNRIIIPATIGFQLVSYQGRDYTGEATCKYLNTSPEQEIVGLKRMVWGLDQVPYDRIVVCEGAFDALSIGPGAVHLGGIKFTQEQVDILREFNKIYIVFDTEPKALSQAKELAQALIPFRAGRVSVIHIDSHDINSSDISTIKQIRRLVQ